MEQILILLIALAFDLLLGEMPAVVHPVVGIGKFLSLVFRCGPKQGKVLPFLYGGAAVFIVAATCTTAGFLLITWLRSANWALYLVVSAILLKACFSVRELARSALRVWHSLIAGQAGKAREDLRWLVSRDTATLTEEDVAAATIESVAENASDSFVAPTLFFLLFGVPGAIAYRVFNTADAMVGYHGKYEYLGKAAARIDDVLNYIPARLTALLIVLSSWIVRQDAVRAWQVMWRDHALTESPNAGWPMSAMAGGLGLCLVKHGHYQLGTANRPVQPENIKDALRVVGLAVAFWVVLVLVAEGALHAIAAQA